MRIQDWAHYHPWSFSIAALLALGFIAAIFWTLVFIGAITIIKLVIEAVSNGL